MSSINEFLLHHQLRIHSNPCISPDACLDWAAMQKDLSQAAQIHAASRFETSHGVWHLAENSLGDHAWLLHGHDAPLEQGIVLPQGQRAYPATYRNLLTLKNLVLEHDAQATIFPRSDGTLGRGTLGVGARFTTLHWPAVDWTMAALGRGVTANQNSIPRELVFDVEAMLQGQLDRVPFPFIGTDVPEGHQGQSVEGMAHFCILQKLKSGFHHRRIGWAFNADHQPVGGKFDRREAALVRGCLLASYITFDLSPELALTVVPNDPASWVSQHLPKEVLSHVRQRLKDLGLTLDQTQLHTQIALVWPAVEKMKRRDTLYTAARHEAFTTAEGRSYLRELSIDELPGLTSPETTAIMLALCEALKMRIDFVAPAFGFQKNMPYPDNDKLRELIRRQWDVCQAFDAGIGFHSGSGKSATNYQIMGEITGGRLEIKTSGRYTYEMGRALAASSNPSDQALWRDWYAFTRQLACTGAFSQNETERQMARVFITETLRLEGKDHPQVWDSPETLRQALETLNPSPDHMFWFEYNFLFVLAAEGRADKSALGDHTPLGYRQRARFYSISAEARLNYAKNVARYLIFLAQTTGLVPASVADQATTRLNAIPTWEEFLRQIAPESPA
ncbi:MAG: tagaturonate epimerase family protein [Verrucomicrobiia bacterium]